MAGKKDPYRILGVNHKADPVKIKKAYRRAAKKYHPDVSPRDEEKFKEVQEAYETLSDPEKKALYDRERSQNSTPRPSDDSLSQPLRPRVSTFFDEIDRFFSTFEDSWMDRHLESWDEREEDQSDLRSIEIILTPSEAKDGCEVPLTVRFRRDCRRCFGAGFKGSLICGLCRGLGKERVQKKVYITVPPGVKNGTQIRIPLKDRDLRGVVLIATLRISQ